MPGSKDIAALIAESTGVISLPSDTYTLTSPIVVPAGRVLDGNGSRIVCNGLAAGIVIAGNLSGVRRLSVLGDKYGIVNHGSLCVVEDVLLNGFDTACLVESGDSTQRLYSTPSDPEWVASDNCQLNRVTIWNSRVGVYAHGDDTNVGVGVSIYGQSVEALIDDNTKSGWTWIGCYHENYGPLGFRLRASGLSTLISCGSDGPIARFETSPGIAVGCAMRIEGPHQAVNSVGLNQLQVGDPAVHQAGLLDGAMSCWSRHAGEAQLFGTYPSDVIGDGNWPPGWRCIGAGPSRRPGMALPGELAAGPRRGAIFPDGIQLGSPPLASTVALTYGTAPPDGPAVEGDWCINTRPITGVDYWRCVVGGDHPIWAARP